MSDDRRRVNDLFDAALERPPAARHAFVTAQAGPDGALRDEVLSLLDAHERAGAFLESPVRVPDAEMDGDARPGPGDLIGSYRVEAELGRGGMGVVYLAEDLRLGRKVALKALAGARNHDERRRERLRKEARAAASLSHSGIATVFALEEIEGELYIASEYVPGRSLRAELEAGTMPLERVLSVGARLAQALAAAHARDIVHRDLKPENVVCGERANVKILDFGIARSPALPGEPGRLTDAGTIVGTPGYMSPEQIEAQEVDFRSDVFSFGVLLYEMATGVHPFEGRTAASTIGRILAHDPSPPSQLRALPAEFDRIVRKCLQKSPADRYQATSDLALDLEHLMRAAVPGAAAEQQAADPRDAAWRPGGSGGGIAAGPTRAVRWWRVHQVAAAAVYAVMTLLAGLTHAWLAADWSGAAAALFFACVACAALNGTLRVHLLFTERHNLPAFDGELRRATPWLRGSDVAVGLVLLALAMPAAGVHVALAILLAAVGAGSIIASIAVEPATTEAAFPDRARS